MAVLLVDLSKKNDEDHIEEDEDIDVLESQETADESDDSSSDSEDLSQNQKRRRSPRKNKGSQPKTKKLKPKVNIKKEALQILSELFRTLLQSVRNEHKTEILEFCQKTLTSCVEEFFETVMIPVPILDELLVCIGQGPRVLVLQQQTQRKEPEADEKQKRGRKRTVGGKTQPVLVTVQQNNPSYLVASAVIRASVERLSTPIATLVNGLVNSDPRYIGQSTISNHVCETSDSDEGNKKKSEIPAEVMEMVGKLGKPQKQQQDIHGTSNVYSVILELQRVAPAILTTVFGNLASHVETSDAAQRTMVVQTLGKLFAGNQSDASGNLKVAYQYNPCFRQWLQRSGDRLLEIRRIMLPHMLALAKAGSYYLTGAAGQSEASSPQAELARDVQDALVRRLASEPSAEFRTEIVQELCNLSYMDRKIVSKKVMDQVGGRVMSKDKTERKNALTGLVQLYFKQYVRHHLSTVLEGGDDCPIESVLEVMDECCSPSTSANGGAGLTSVIAARSKAVSSSSAGTKSSPRKAKKRGRKGGRRRRDEDSEPEESDEENEELNNSRDISFALVEADDFSYFQWIPCVLFESASYTDAIDSDMHSRVIQLMDEILLGCSLHPDKNKQLTSTGRATGLAVMLDAIKSQSQVAWHGMETLQSTRAKLQKTLKNYLDARADIRNFETGMYKRHSLYVAQYRRFQSCCVVNCKAHFQAVLQLFCRHLPIFLGTEAYFVADAKAKDLLEKVAAMIPQPSGAAPSPEERHPVLEKFHAIKDKHIFRLLGTITKPNHTVKARLRALDDLPKRVKATAGDSVQAWVKSLAKRCAMGDFINEDTIHHCVLLAQECYFEGEHEAALKFLACVQLAVESFPSLCASDDVFENLSELFRDSSSSSSKTSDESAIITSLASILALVSPFRESATDSGNAEEDLQKKLVALCQNGTPEQARHAVATMASLLKPKDEETLTQGQTDAFLPLLQTLATPSRLSVSSTGSSTKLVCVLVALAELADHAPKVFESSTRGSAALKFALEKVLMGRAHASKDNEESESDPDDDDAETKVSSKRGRTNKKTSNVASHLSASAGTKSLVEKENLSLSCRTLCAAIEFLSTFIRSTVFTAKKTRSILSKSSLDLIGQVFHILSQLLRDKGLPPSSRDRKLCSLGQDKAALRQCAAINLFRLCDTRLGLDQRFLSTERWHYLASVFLDEDLVVRKAVMAEFGMMITCHGKFAPTSGLGAMAPRLRFVAMSVFCVDGSQGSHSKANGNAANIGKDINYQKGNIAGCIGFLRKVYEETAAVCRAQGLEAEERFENLTKLTIMPEYSIPYAFHLLACRKETPSSARSGRRVAGKVVDEEREVDENGQKVLRKRLKSLYDPIVLQLGTSADNISFLLRMAEMIAKSFQPIGFPSYSSGTNDGEVELDKVTNVCATAREVLLSYVKKDVNLDTHPGAIRMPGNLFRKKAIQKVPAKEVLSSKPTMETEDHNSASRKPTAEMQDEGSKTDENDSEVSADSISGEQNESIISENREGEAKRKSLRRSSRSTRSTKFDDPSDSVTSSSVGDESSKRSVRETQDGSQPIGSSMDSVSDVGLRSPHGKESFKKTRRSDMSQGSLANSRVHFSPEVDFGGLSPINRRLTRDHEKDQSLLSSSETKTRGTTPPSALRDTNFTATASIGAASSRRTNSPSYDSQSPTTVTESTGVDSVARDKSQGKKKSKPLGDAKTGANKSRQKRKSTGLPAIDKENTTNAGVQAKKNQGSKQIKIVRSKSNLKQTGTKNAQKKPRARAAKRAVRGRKSNSTDLFDFEG